MAKAKVKVGVYKKRQRVYGYGYDKPDLISEEQFEELVADRKEEPWFNFYCIQETFVR